MKIVELNWRPTDRQLRQFGCAAVIALPLLAWICRGSTHAIGAAMIAAMLIASAGWFLPGLLRPLFVALSLLTFPLGIVIGELAMLIMYLSVFFPIAVVFRLCGRDALQLRPRRQVASYWQPKPQPRGAGSYLRLW